MALTPTAWGYDADGLEPIVDVDEFAELTGSGAASEQMEAAVLAASSAVRSFCRWHVTPVVECEAVLSPDAGTVRLPALRVASVDSVAEDGVELDSDCWEWRREGLLRRKHGRWQCGWGGLTVDYAAGFPADAVPEVARVTVQLAMNALNPMGVSQESAGGVSITYNKDADGQGGSLALTESMRAVLAPFRLPSGAW